MNALGSKSALVGLGLWLLTGGAGAFCVGAQAAGMPEADQKALKPLFDAGVIGAPAAGAPLAVGLAALADGTWTYRTIAGKDKGQTDQHIVQQLKRDATGASWRYEAGPKHILYLHDAADGSLDLVSEEDIEQGVLTTYSPPEPIVVPGLKPGESRQYSVAVNVFDLSQPDELKYQGNLAVTYSNLGGYKVTVPAGSWDAALIKWTFNGKVGPANIEDTQYRFAVDKVGMIARIEKKDISALLFYHDNSKSVKVLVKQP
jgi:hypothetical protein